MSLLQGVLRREALAVGDRVDGAAMIVEDQRVVVVAARISGEGGRARQCRCCEECFAVRRCRW